MQVQADFGPNPGQLRMLLHLPPGLASDAPLVVALHGCAQGAEAFASQAGWLALADRFRFAVLAPEQTAANNPNRCFNWFSPGDIQRGQGEAASIAEMVAFVGRTSGQGRAGAFVTGLSAGGAMTAVMLATYPELFRAGAVIAGLPYGAAESIPEAMRIMSRPGGRDSADLADIVRRAAPATKASPKLSIWHGDADRVVHAGNATELARQWTVVAGLGTQPDSTRIIGPTTRSVWRDAAGDTQVELNLVRDLGHGVPLAARGADGVGQVAPYMLEAGVSSSREILRFWGLPTDVGVAPSTPVAAGADEARRAEPETGAAQEVSGRLAGHVLGVLKDKIPTEVEAVIAKALRAAGLMT